MRLVRAATTMTNRERSSGRHGTEQIVAEPASKGARGRADGGGQWVRAARVVKMQC
jgi:hypothetical protein